MKNILITFLIFIVSNSFAATLKLGGGESAIIQANVSAKVSCGGNSSTPDGGSEQCYQENANLRVQINQLQNDLYQCQSNNQNHKVWNCTYVCGGNNGMGSDVDKSVACREAKRDSGVQCSSQCECTQE
jgi:hypothetical protein